MSTSAFTQLLDTADAPAPGQTARAGASANHKARREAARDTRFVSSIQPGHRLAFQALTSGHADEFGIMSCVVNGAPSALIVMGRHIDAHRVEIIPLFVALAPGMVITDPDGDIIFGEQPES